MKISERVLRARDLLAMRRTGTQIAVDADQLNSDVASAYELSAACVGLTSSQVVAWKLGATTAGTQDLFKTREVYFGALTADQVWRPDDCAQFVPPPALAGEAEIALRVAKDITPGQPFGQEQLVFDAWAPVIECPWSVFSNIRERGLIALLSDRCAAGALFFGEPSSDLASPEINAELQIKVDGCLLATGSASGSLLMSPRDAALEFLQIANAHGVTVRAGQWISTGGITPCIPLPFGKVISLHLGGKEVFSVLVPPSR